jgi:hypothetical protein
MQNAQNLEIGRMNDVGVGYDKAVAEVERVLCKHPNFFKASDVVRSAVAAMVWSMICMRYSRVIYKKDIDAAIQEFQKQLSVLK